MCRRSPTQNMYVQKKAFASSCRRVGERVDVNNTATPSPASPEHFFFQSHRVWEQRVCEHLESESKRNG